MRSKVRELARICSKLVHATFFFDLSAVVALYARRFWGKKSLENTQLSFRFSDENSEQATRLGEYSEEGRG